MQSLKIVPILGHQAVELISGLSYSFLTPIDVEDILVLVMISRTIFCKFLSLVATDSGVVVYFVMDIRFFSLKTFTVPGY